MLLTSNFGRRESDHLMEHKIEKKAVVRLTHDEADRIAKGLEWASTHLRQSTGVGSDIGEEWQELADFFADIREEMTY